MLIIFNSPFTSILLDDIQKVEFLTLPSENAYLFSTIMIYKKEHIFHSKMDKTEKLLILPSLILVPKPGL